MKQLTIGSGLNIEYGFPATGNNGKLDYEKDLITGEKVTYTYDALNRLASATSDVNPGWGQSFGYDGFGNNTTQTITKGSAPSLSVTYNASTNRRPTDCADANGNIGSVANSCSEGYTYDVMNRITAVGSSAYSYSPSNQRVWRNTSATGAEITYYGATGQKLRTFSLSSTLTVTTTGTFYYFGGKLIKNAGGFVTPDRLGSHGKYFPYGQERPSATANNKEKFATYYRDSETGLDYANNRFHQPGHGRFMTPDPLDGSAKTIDPGSWNRYAYTGGDPVNRLDPNGLNWFTSMLSSVTDHLTNAFGAAADFALHIGLDRVCWVGDIFSSGNPCAPDFSGWTPTPQVEVVDAEITGYYEKGDCQPGGAICHNLLTDEIEANPSSSPAIQTVPGPLLPIAAMASAGLSAGVTVTAGTTQLFRAVNEAELSSIEGLGGTFTQGSYSFLNGKYFSTTLEGASAEARMLGSTSGSASGAYTVVQTSLPTHLMSEIFVVDGGVPTTIVATEILPYLTPGVPLNYVLAPWIR